ncbi:hypothetical protein J132_01289 [Termitomyces sp. J132]|nr:hypothetical protein J132_01289 [Termitomyces sp. J132]
MPAPFALLQRAPGNWDDIYDRQAIEMSISHNMFIRGINAVYLQTPKIRKHEVKAFAFFCNSLFMMIRHHHTIEEELLFPFFESKMGPNAMGQNLEQHHQFQEGLDDLERYIKKVLGGQAVYDGSLVIKKLDSFADDMVKHLHDELSTIESSRMRAAFTEKELEDAVHVLKKRVLKDVSLTIVLPLGLILHDKSTAPQFPPLPKFVLWLVRHGKPKPDFRNDL